ncbi:MAG: ribose 5-phosphate isomerase B [bacterium]
MGAEKKIAIGSDHAGYRLKEELAKKLEEAGWAVENVGTYGTESCDYPDFGRRVAAKVRDGKCARGVLVCGSGVGMAMVANKVKGVRAVNCTEPLSARLSRLHNDSNVLCLGERIVGNLMAWEILNAWLSAEFDGGRHQRRVDMIDPAD